MSEVEFLKIQTCTLKVNIHCEGCKQKVKKILQKIDGVYIIKFEAEMGKVTVSGDVDPETLIRKLNNDGKHAELIGDPKENNGLRVEDGKGARRKKGGGQKGNNTHLPPPQQVKCGNLPSPAAMLNPQQMKALQDLMTKLPPRYNVPVNGDGAQVPIPKSVKFDLQESDDISGDDTEDDDCIEDYEEEGGADDVPPLPMVGNANNGQGGAAVGGGVGISMINDRARAAHVMPPNRMAVPVKTAPGGNVGPTGVLPIPQRGTQVGHIPNFQIPTPLDIPATGGGGATVQVGGAAVHAGYYLEAPTRNPLHPQQTSGMTVNHQPAAPNSYPQQAMYFRPYIPPSPLYPSYPNPPLCPPPQDNYYSDDEETTGCSVM